LPNTPFLPLFHVQYLIFDVQRAVGIPRTFLSFLEQKEEEGDGEEGDGSTKQFVKLQVNSTGFEELLKRGGGKSFESSLKKTLKHALQVTNTEIPDYITCGICHQVVQNAMLLPWDLEGRTACENCIRPALADNHFVCPLTGTENVSPDELVPNIGLRKAAETFIKSVLEKMEEIEEEAKRLIEQEGSNPILESDGQGKNVLDDFETSQLVRSSKERGGLTISKKAVAARDPFDEFGGDVFDVSEETEEAKVESKIVAELKKNGKDESDKAGERTALDVVISQENRNLDFKTQNPPSTTARTKLPSPDHIATWDSSCVTSEVANNFNHQDIDHSTVAPRPPPKKNQLAGYILGPAAPIITGMPLGSSPVIPPPPSRLLTNVKAPSKENEIHGSLTSQDQHSRSHYQHSHQEVGSFRAGNIRGRGDRYHLNDLNEKSERKRGASKDSNGDLEPPKVIKSSKHERDDNFKDKRSKRTNNIPRGEYVYDDSQTKYGSENKNLNSHPQSKGKDDRRVIGRYRDGSNDISEDHPAHRNTGGTVFDSRGGRRGGRFPPRGHITSDRGEYRENEYREDSWAGSQPPSSFARGRGGGGQRAPPRYDIRGRGRGRDLNRGRGRG